MEKTWIFIIIGILILILIVKPDILSRKDIQTASITATYYDINGKEIIKQPETFSLGKLFPSRNIINDYTTPSSEKNSSLIQHNNFFINFFNDIKKIIGLGSFAIVPYTTQCSLPSCPSGYVDGGATCDDVTHICTRTCTQTIAGYCGTFGGFSSLISNFVTTKPSNGILNSGAYSLSINTCYRFYAEGRIDVTGGTGTLVIGALGISGVYISGGYSCTGATLNGNSGTLICDSPTAADIIKVTKNAYESASMQDQSALGYSTYRETISLYGASAPYTPPVTNNAPQTCTYTSSCTESWTCTAWSTCSGGIQTRTCTDLNACGTTTTKPAESQTCTVCTPTTCSALGLTCGTASDGCGGTLTCGTACPTGTGGWIYQENANTTTLAGSWTYPANIYDGNYVSYGYTVSSQATLSLVYTKPSGATSALWQIKGQDGIIRNLTMSAACFNYSSTSVSLKLVQDGYGGGIGLTDTSYYYCDSTNELLGTTAGHTFYEEGIWWNIPSTITYAKYQVNVTNAGNIPYNNVQLVNFVDPTLTTNWVSYFPSITYSLSNGQSANWTSNLIDITSYTGKTFTANINAFNTYTNQWQYFFATKLIP